MAALTLVFGPAQAEWPREAVRLMLPAQLLIAVAVISRPAVVQSPYPLARTISPATFTSRWV
jgi:hypothetical protein